VGATSRCRAVGLDGEARCPYELSTRPYASVTSSLTRPSVTSGRLGWWYRRLRLAYGPQRWLDDKTGNKYLKVMVQPEESEGGDEGSREATTAFIHLPLGSHPHAFPVPRPQQ